MGRRNIDEVESYLEEAITNIRNDRTVTNNLLTDLITEIKSDPSFDTHKDLGSVAAKYVETLQRSNEQLVKITSILYKKTPSSKELTEDDKKFNREHNLIPTSKQLESGKIKTIFKPVKKKEKLH